MEIEFKKDVIFGNEMKYLTWASEDGHTQITIWPPDKDDPHCASVKILWDPEQQTSPDDDDTIVVALEYIEEYATVQEAIDDVGNLLVRLAKKAEEQMVEMRERVEKAEESYQRLLNLKDRHTSS